MSVERTIILTMIDHYCDLIGASDRWRWIAFLLVHPSVGRLVTLVDWFIGVRPSDWCRPIDQSAIPRSRSTQSEPCFLLILPQSETIIQIYASIPSLNSQHFLLCIPDNHLHPEELLRISFWEKKSAQRYPRDILGCLGIHLINITRSFFFCLISIRFWFAKEVRGCITSTGSRVVTPRGLNSIYQHQRPGHQRPTKCSPQLLGWSKLRRGTRISITTFSNPPRPRPLPFHPPALQSGQYHHQSIHKLINTITIFSTMFRNTHSLDYMRWINFHISTSL